MEKCRALPHLKSQEEIINQFIEFERNYPSIKKWKNWCSTNGNDEYKILSLFCCSITKNSNFSSLPNTTNIIESEHSQISRTIGRGKKA